GLISFVLIFGGVSAIANHRGYDAPVAGILTVLLGIVGIITAWLIARSRKRAIAVTAQPTSLPRNLGLVDSWHVVVAELGRDFANVKRRLIESIAEENASGITSQLETYTHRAPNGYEH